LSPIEDNFNSKCIVGVIASRLLEKLRVLPPENPSILIYIGDPKQHEIDPQQQFVMVECHNGYFEASRHTLMALQKLAKER
jgi:helicase required for RNAi-mediated heterochromatin assembly 1